jgi:hypothetical protein
VDVDQVLPPCDPGELAFVDGSILTVKKHLVGR